jgi:hypothetical protein
VFAGAVDAAGFGVFAAFVETDTFPLHPAKPKAETTIVNKIVFFIFSPVNFLILNL